MPDNAKTHYSHTCVAILTSTLVMVWYKVPKNRGLLRLVKISSHVV